MTKAEQHMQQLAQHTFQFAQSVRDLGVMMPLLPANLEDFRAMVRASGMAGEWLLRAQEAGSQPAFRERIRQVVEEIRVTHYYLGLLNLQSNQDLALRRTNLMKGAEELVEIFRKIL